jgi:hypothetical protein
LRSDWARDSTDLQNLTTWFIQHLFGDSGLQSLCQHVSQYRQTDQSSVFEANIGDSSQPIDLMQEVLQKYQNVVQSDQATECIYLERARHLAMFQNRHRTLWYKFMQAGSAERRALLLQSRKEGLLFDSEDNSVIIHDRILHLAWKWIERKTGHTKATIVKQLCFTYHLKAMVEVLGLGALRFMDKQ